MAGGIVAERTEQLLHDPVDYQLFGLRVRSEIPIDASESPSEDCDVSIGWGEPTTVPEQAPDGRRIAGLEVNNHTLHVAVEVDAGFLLRFHQVCDVRVSSDLRQVTVAPDPNGQSGMIPILLAGNVVAFLLTMGGIEVLHGSAVEIDGRAVAFVGESGSGKSTLAGEACAAGARLVADDLLAMELSHGGPRCRRGGGRLRLRPGVAELADRLPGSTSATYDHRTAVAARPAQSERPPLAAIVLPRVTDRATEPRLSRLIPRDAFSALTPFHRLAGLTDPAAVRRHFHTCIDLAHTLPVLDLEMAPGDAARAAAASTDRTAWSLSAAGA